MHVRLDITTRSGESKTYYIEPLASYMAKVNNDTAIASDMTVTHISSQFEYILHGRTGVRVSLPTIPVIFKLHGSKNAHVLIDWSEVAMLVVATNNM